MKPGVSKCTMENTEEIWKAYHKRLAAYIGSRVKADRVEDILHEVFLKVHKQLDSLNDKGRIESWLFQITRNAIIDHYRSQRSTVDIAEWEESTDESDDGELRREFASCLRPIIEQLPEKYRQAIQLSEMEQKTQQQVADEIGISLSGAKSRVQRGRAMLRGLLDECCHIELNQSNQLVSYEQKKSDCYGCD